jgi:hypothetical protein
MTRLITREAWGALPPKNPGTPFAPGAGRILVVHYTGRVGAEGVPADKPAVLQTMQRMYQGGGRGDGQNYVDAPYNFVIFNDAEDAVYELRGFRMRGGANGNATSNAVEPSVCVYVGTEDEIDPAVIRKMRWLTGLVQEHFDQTTAHEGHRDNMATACPGERLYALVKNGAFVPTPLSPPDPNIDPVGDDMTTLASIPGRRAIFVLGADFARRVANESNFAEGARLGLWPSVNLSDPDDVAAAYADGRIKLVAEGLITELLGRPLQGLETV